MSRLPQATRESIKEDLRETFDDVSSGPGGTGATGPMAVLKHSPELLRRATPLFNYLRNESSLPWHVRELAMIVTARLTDCQYIWNAHVALGRQSGLNDNLIDSLRDKKPLPQLSPEESAVVNCGTEFFTTRRISQETFDSVLGAFGPQGLVELTSLMGYYAMLAFNANAVDLRLPEETEEPRLPL